MDLELSKAVTKRIQREKFRVSKLEIREWEKRVLYDPRIKVGSWKSDKSRKVIQSRCLGFLKSREGGIRGGL